VALTQRVQAQLVGDLRGVHGVGQVLLVSEHKQHGVAQLVLVQHAVQLIACLPDTVAIVRVHHEDQPLRVLEVVPPQRADLEGRSLARQCPNASRAIRDPVAPATGTADNDAHSRRGWALS
jgi:hypothetical protein